MAEKKRKDDKIRVFLSHGSQGEDREFSRKLSDAISARSDALIFDAETLAPGKNWQEELRKNLLDSNVVLFVLTPDSSKSSMMLQEMGAAWAANKKMGVVTTDPGLAATLPVIIDRKLLVKAEDIEKPEVIDRLLEDVKL